MYRATITNDINLAALLETAVAAGDAIMDIYHSEFDVYEKLDGSPLTKADKISNAIITDFLARNYSLPILSEENENVAYPERKDWKEFWMIDPLDGTKEFIHKRREFTVNIALIRDGIPVLGMIYAPVFQEVFYAIKGRGAFMQYRDQVIKIVSKSHIKLNQGKILNPSGKLIKVLTSFSHNHGFDLKTFMSSVDSPIRGIRMGSSLKFCRVAQGLADFNIRTGPTMEWDTAAGQLILEESGRGLLDLTYFQPLVYNKENLLNPYFIAI